MKPLENLDKNMPILIVDDFSTVRRVVKNCLSQLGFKNVIEAESADSALEALRDKRVELVISDWNIPDHSGMDFVKVMRDDNNLKSMPLLMIVPASQKKELEKVSDKGEEYIVKPFTTIALQQKLSTIFEEKYDSK